MFCHLVLWERLEQLLIIYTLQWHIKSLGCQMALKHRVPGSALDDEGNSWVFQVPIGFAFIACNSGICSLLEHDAPALGSRFRLAKKPSLMTIPSKICLLLGNTAQLG